MNNYVWDPNWDVGDIKVVSWGITAWNALRINHFEHKINGNIMGTGHIVTICDALAFNPTISGEHITQVISTFGSCTPGCQYNNDPAIRGIWMISNFGNTYKCVGNLDEDMEMKTFNAEKLLTSNGLIELVSFSGYHGTVLNGFYTEFRIYSSIYQLIIRHPWTYFINEFDLPLHFYPENTN